MSSLTGIYARDVSVPAPYYLASNDSNNADVNGGFIFDGDYIEVWCDDSYSNYSYTVVGTGNLMKFEGFSYTSSCDDFIQCQGEFS